MFINGIDIILIFTYYVKVSIFKWNVGMIFIGTPQIKLNVRAQKWIKTDMAKDYFLPIKLTLKIFSKVMYSNEFTI